MIRPLAGVKVLDFSTLLPGPVCTLVLAEAGADVLKIERPGVGDEMRTYTPKFGADSVNFALLNRGKRSIALDLKKGDSIEKLTPLIESADVVVEQFRPGVMERLGLGPEVAMKRNPKLVYGRMTGWGQDGPLAPRAGHDLGRAGLRQPDRTALLRRSRRVRAGRRCGVAGGAGAGGRRRCAW